MTDHELEQRLRAWYQTEIPATDVAPADLRSSLRAIPVAATAAWRRGHTRGRGFTLLAAAALVSLLAGTAIVGSKLLEPSPSPTPLTVGACGPGSVDIRAAAADAPMPADASSIQIPADGRIAMALEESEAGGSIVVVGPDGEGPRVVATFSGQEIAEVSGVQVLEWSPDGESFLVGARSRGWECENLFLVQGDGSAVTRLTDFGLDEGAGDGRFSPSGTRITYTVGNELYVSNLDGAAQSTGTTCRSIVGELRWAPDEARILVQCDASLYIFDLSKRGSRYQVPLGPLDARWVDGDEIVVALGDEAPGLTPGPLRIVDLNALDLTFRHRVLSDVSQEWMVGVPMLSPDSRWLLVWGGGDVNPLPYPPTFLVDTATGATTQMPWPVLPETILDDPMRRRPGATWLPGNDRVLTADAGILYEVDLLGITRTAVGSVPAPDFAWFPLPR